MSAAFAILGGNVAVVGDLASVKPAVDTNGTASLATDPEFKAAQASTTMTTSGSPTSTCERSSRRPSMRRTSSARMCRPSATR